MLIFFPYLLLYLPQAVLSCPFMSDHDIDFYAYKLPIMVLLAANTFFLVWIMVVSGYNTMTLCLDHEAITLKKLTC